MRRVGDVLQVEETVGAKSPQWGWVWCIRVFQLKVWVSDQWHQHDRELGRNAEFQRILPRPIESQMHFNENVGNVQSHYSLRSTGLEEFKGGYRSWCTVGQENKVMNLWEAFHLNLPIPPTSSACLVSKPTLCLWRKLFSFSIFALLLSWKEATEIPIEQMRKLTVKVFKILSLWMVFWKW